MVFDAGEPECPQRQPLILVGIIFRVSGANATVVTPAAMLASADDAPGLEATKVLAHATIHPAVTGAATTSVGACGTTDWAESITVN